MAKMKLKSMFINLDIDPSHTTKKAFLTEAALLPIQKRTSACVEAVYNDLLARGKAARHITTHAVGHYIIDPGLPHLDVITSSNF